MDYNSGLSYAKKEGMKQGLKEGIEQGLKEGEKNATKNTARKMLGKNMNIEDIIELTGLSKEEIENLKNEK